MRPPHVGYNLCLSVFRTASVRKDLPLNRRSLLALLSLAGVYACAKLAQKVIAPTPDTDIVLLYSSADKGDFEKFW